MDSNSGSQVIVGMPVAYLILKLVFDFLREKGGKDRRGTKHTFAENPDLYWANMEAKVTEPIIKVLDKQTDILSTLALAAVRDDERRKMQVEQTIQQLAKSAKAGMQ